MTVSGFPKIQEAIEVIARRLCNRLDVSGVQSPYRYQIGGIEMTGGFSINITPEGVESSYELRDVTYVEKLMLLDIVRRGLHLEAADIHKFASLLDAGAFEDYFEKVTEEEFRNEN